MVVAEFRTDSGNNVKVYSDGDVYINGRMDSKIYPDGEIWSYGKNIAKIYPDGEIWSGGCKVGRIYSDGEIWLGSTCVARANGGYSGNGTDTSYSNNTDDYSLSDVGSRKQKQHSAVGIAVGGGMLENSNGIGCVAILVGIYLVVCMILFCFVIWKILFNELSTTTSISEIIEMIMVIVSAITTMVIQFRMNCKGKGGKGYFINLVGMLIIIASSMFYEEGSIGVFECIVLSAFFAAVPTMIVTSIFWVIKKIKNIKKTTVR